MQLQKLLKQCWIFCNALNHTNFRMYYGEMKEENALEITADKVALISKESHKWKT